MGRPQGLRAALFDFDGTLCDTEGHNLRLVQEVLAGMGAQVPLSVLEGLAGCEDRVVVPRLMAEYGATGTIEEYERRRDGCYRTYSEADLVPEPGAVELLEGLRERGVKVGLVSMTVSRSVLTALNRLGMLSLFDAVVCGDMVSARKPSPVPYRAALALFGVAPADAVVVEDSPTGIAAGRAAGCHVIAYTGASIRQDVSAADEVTDTFVGLEL